MLNDCQSQGAALRRKTDASGRRHARRKRRIEVNSWIRVDDAHAVWANQSHARGATDLDQLRLVLLALCACLRESSRDHDERFHSFAAASCGCFQDAFSRDDDDTEIDRTGNVFD